MYALHSSARLAPKKANLMAKMVRGLSVPDALTLLSKTHKKSARLFETVLQSAIANAEHNFKQSAQSMMLKEVIVNQGTAYRRGIPMARGRVRPIRKFLCHISITLGYKEGELASKKNVTKSPASKSNPENQEVKESSTDTPKKKNPYTKKKS